MKQFTIAGTSLVATFVLIGGVVSAANVDPAKKTTDNADPLIYQETVQVDLSADSNNIAWFKYYAQSTGNSASYYVTATGSNVSVKVYSANDLSKPLTPRTNTPKGAYDFYKGSWYYISCEKTVESQDASFTLKVSDYKYGATNIAKDQDVYYYLGTTDQVGGKTKVNGLKTINGSIQYFEDGILQNGWQTIDGKKYYFKSGKAVTGFQSDIDGKAYGFGEDGVQLTGLEKIGNYTYYFGGEDGEALTGIQRITEGEGKDAVENIYYFQETGNSKYRALKNDSTIVTDEEENEKFYWFDSDGRAYKGWQRLRASYQSPYASYYFDPTDAYAWNGLQTVGTGEDAGLCYFKDYKAQTGFQTITVGEGDEAVENTYYFGKDFKAYTGLCQVENAQSTEWCLFDDNGVAQSGWQTVVTDEEEKISWDFYFNPVNYYAYKGFKTIDGKRYYFDDEFAYAREGWQKDSTGKVYYFDPEAEHPCAVTGLNTVKNEICFFDDNGIAIEGWKTINGKQYYFNPKAEHHKALTGFQYNIDGKTYMFGADGVALTGFQKYAGDTYYFDPIAEHPCALKGGIKSITINNMTQKYNFDDYGVVRTGWYQDDDDYYYYFDKEGFYALTGLQEVPVDGVEGLHFFDSEGRECYGWIYVGEDAYYFDYNSGAAYTGLQDIEGSWYLFGEDGVRLLGLQTVTIGEGEDAVEVEMFFDYCALEGFVEDYETEDKLYFFAQTEVVEDSDEYYPILIKDQLLNYEGDLYLIGEDGVLLSGWQTYEGNKYYFDPEAEHPCAVTGLQTIEGKLYLFDDDGVVKSGLTEYGNGTFYFFDEKDNYAISGLKVIEGDKYFFNTSNYKMEKNKIETVDGKTYCFGEDGKAITGWHYEWVEEDWYYFSETDNAALTGIQNLEDETFIFGEDGCMLTGLQNYEGKWYYLDDCAWIGYCDFGDDGAYLFGVDGAALTGLQEVSGKMYFFDTETAKQVKDAVAADEDGNVYLIDEDGAPVTDELFTDEDGNTYYFGEDGKAVTGINENADGSLSFYDEETAIRVESDFATDSEGNTYYLDEDGKAITDDTATIGEDTYYFDEDGVMAEDELVETDDGTFYFGEDGAMKTGWVKVEGTWYYMDKEDGSMVTGKFTDTDGNVYLLGEDGKMVTGWVKNEDGTWTYYTSSGAMATGWAQAGSKWYFFNADGSMATGWKFLGGVWYYLDATNGDMATGWKQVGSSWYYFDASGHMVTGMQTINGRNYFFVESGSMATGWRIIDGSWYYFASNGAMVTGWQLINGTWYYLDTNGVMVTGSKTINGKAYEFASSGACTNPYI